jgi:hypothetical protein
LARAAYPGTFNPPTVAHLAIAEAALAQGNVDEVHLVVSHHPLGKNPTGPAFEQRISVLEAVAASRPWLAVVATPNRLIAEVVAGYEAVIMGTDKWLQVTDPAWYGGSAVIRDEAVASLPRVLLAPRGHEIEPSRLPSGSLVLDISPDHGLVSSTDARRGRVEWILPEALPIYEPHAMYEPHSQGDGG